MAHSLRISSRAQLLLICVATLCVFGPHLLILGYQAAGIRAPAALTFVCPLHHAGGGSSRTLSPGWSTGAWAGWATQPPNKRPLSGR